MWLRENRPRSTLGTFANQLRKANVTLTTSLRLSVRPSVRPHGTVRMDFCEVDYKEFLL
jgi:hypothetical protein